MPLLSFPAFCLACLYVSYCFCLSASLFVFLGGYKTARITTKKRIIDIQNSDLTKQRLLQNSKCYKIAIFNYIRNVILKFLLIINEEYVKMSCNANPHNLSSKLLKKKTFKIECNSYPSNKGANIIRPIMSVQIQVTVNVCKHKYR